MVISKVVALVVPQPFAAVAMLGFLASHTVPGVEHVRDRTYFRALRLSHGTGTIALTLPAQDDPAAVRAVIRLDDRSDLRAAVDASERFLDLRTDPITIDGALAADPALAAPVVATPGLRVPGA